MRTAKIPARKGSTGRREHLTEVQTSLKKAGGLYHRKDFSKAIELVRQLIEKAVFDNISEELDCYRLLAFAHANSNNYTEAETAGHQGLSLDSSDRDFHFVLAYVSANYKDYRKCLECASRFLELYENRKDRATDIGYLSDGHLDLLYNYLGLACQAENQLPEAEEAFLKSIRLNQAYNHPYLNLAALYQRNREYGKAEKIIETGLKKCSQVQELRILKKSLESRATVSACMMVKNEEELLPRCLESIRSWVDEIIVVDTGSTDRTVEIARSYGARVYFQEWSKDFSRHRNFSLSKATCDWILVIDADEEFVQNDLVILRQSINQNEFRLVSVSVLNVDMETGECTSFLPSTRLFRRDAGFYYDGIVHNQLKFEESETILRAGVRIKHYGYNLSPELRQKKVARSRELLEKQLSETPDDPFVHFNYAQLLRGITNKPDDELCELIKEHGRRAVELTDPDDIATLPIHLQGLHQQATTLIHQGKYEESEKLCRRALEIKPDYLDAIYSLGECYGRMRRFDEAEKYFRKYLEEQRKYKPSDEQLSIILLFGFARHRAYYSLGLIRMIQNNPVEAEGYFLKTLAEQEPYSDTYLKLASIYLDRKDTEKAFQYIEKELTADPDSDIANLYMARYFGLKNDDTEAEKYLEKAVALTQGNPEVYERGSLYWLGKGEYDKAIAFLQELVGLKPTYASGVKLLAKAQYDGANFKDSLKSYRQFLQLEPGDPEAVNNLANCHFKLGDYEEAEKLFTEALEIDDRLAVSYRNLGLTKLHLGKLKEALVLLEKYNEISPDDLEIELAIGGIYSQSGDYSEAIRHFEKYLRWNPKSVDGLFNISECYYRLGYIDSAAIGYRQILERKPDFEPAKSRLREIEVAGTPA